MRILWLTGAVLLAIGLVLLFAMEDNKMSMLFLMGAMTLILVDQYRGRRR